MYGDNYVWFTSASLGTKWYHNTKPFDSFCTPAHLRTAVDGHFFVTRMDLRGDGAITASGLVLPLSVFDSIAFYLFMPCSLCPTLLFFLN